MTMEAEIAAEKEKLKAAIQVKFCTTVSKEKAQLERSRCVVFYTTPVGQQGEERIVPPLVDITVLPVFGLIVVLSRNDSRSQIKGDGVFP